MLKTFINGSSVNLTPVGKPPVTFINGSKKKLVKGVTFINGNKVVLWDSQELQINYIDLQSVSGADFNSPVGFFANRNRVIYSSNNYVNRLNTSNFGAVTLDARVEMGAVMGFSSVDSDSNTAVYYACNRGSSSRTFNQLNVVLSTGEVTASNSQSLNGTWNVNATGYIGGWLNANSVGNVARSVNIRRGDTYLYGYQALTSSGSLSGYFTGCPNFTKIDSTTMVGRYQVYSSGVTTTQIGEFTTSGVTDKGGMSGTEFLVDGDTVVVGGAGLGIYTRNISGNYVMVVEVSSLANHYERLVGKCRGYYYTVCEPANSNGTGDDAKYFLRVFDGSGVVVDTVELTGLSTYVNSVQNILVPQLSQTGYLVYGNLANKKLVVIQCY